MEKNFLVICDNAFVDPQNKINIIGIFDTINVIGFPAAVKNMFIVTSFVLPIGKYSETAKIKKGTWEIKTSESFVDKTTESKHRFIHNFSNIVFPEQGEYSVEIEINGVIEAKDKIYVKVH